MEGRKKRSRQRLWFGGKREPNRGGGQSEEGRWRLGEMRNRTVEIGGVLWIGSEGGNI